MYLQSSLTKSTNKTTKKDINCEYIVYGKTLGKYQT